MRFIKIIFVAMVLSGCSVYKAASNEGISVSDIKNCTTKECFLSKGMKVIDKHKEENGQYIVTYRAIARKTGANYFRAAGHGVLDVATLGLWEIVGTPVEGAISNNRGYIMVKLFYLNQASEVIEKLEIYNAEGEKVRL